MQAILAMHDAAAFSDGGSEARNRTEWLSGLTGLLVSFVAWHADQDAVRGHSHGDPA